MVFIILACHFFLEPATMTLRLHWLLSCRNKTMGSSLIQTTDGQVSSNRWQFCALHCATCDLCAFIFTCTAKIRELKEILSWKILATHQSKSFCYLEAKIMRQPVLFSRSKIIIIISTLIWKCIALSPVNLKNMFLNSIFLKFKI